MEGDILNLWMAGLDHESAAIAQREKLSFVEGQVAALDAAIKEDESVSGCVLLSTCNRTELYISALDGATIDPSVILYRAAGLKEMPAMQIRRGQEAARHLMEVAGGLRSQIVGEDQIGTQVKRALEIARKAKSTDGVLETLFRYAVTAGKEIRTQVKLISVPRSAAAMGVALAEQMLGGLAGCRAVVIGNGEMGRLACGELTARGAQVTVTLRSYRHGETVVPRGCKTIDYENRMHAIAQAQLVISATTSPHYTVTADQLSALPSCPRLMIDLALPRDIEPQAGELTILKNMDDLGKFSEEGTQEREKAEEIIDRQMNRFLEWLHYRDALPLIEQLSQTAFQRVYTGEGDEDLIRTAVEKTIDMMLGGMKEAVTPQLLEGILSKMQRAGTGIRQE